jgi:mitogen-activated protein kinase 7
VGCILAELLGGRPFFKGRDYVDQLNQILHILGTPNEETLSRIGSPRAQEYVRNLPHMPKRLFPSLFPQANPDALDLLDHMLAFDPSSRISVERALEHPYLHIWHDASDEPGCPTTFNFDFEVVDEVAEMRQMILDEVIRFRQQVRIQPGQQQHMQGMAQQTGQVPMPQDRGGPWTADEPRPQEAYHPAHMGGLEQELQGGLDAGMHQ